MKLEDIARTYGMNDYYDMVTGRIYKLSEATDAENGKLTVPVYEDGRFIGNASMNKVDQNS